MFPWGFFLLFLAAFFIAFDAAESVVYLLKSNKLWLLLLIFLCTLSAFIKFEISFAGINIFCSILLPLVMIIIVVGYISRYFKADVKSLLAVLLASAVFIFAKIADFVADYRIMLLSPYLLAPLSSFVLLLLLGDLRRGLHGICSGYFASEIFGSLLQDGGNIVMGGVATADFLFTFLFCYTLLYLLRGRLKGFSVHDIY